MQSHLSEASRRGGAAEARGGRRTRRPTHVWLRSSPASARHGSRTRSDCSSRLPPAWRRSRTSDAELRQSLEELRREVGERDKMLNFMMRRTLEFENSSGNGGVGGRGVSGVSGFVGDYRSKAPRFGKIRVPECLDPMAEESFWEREGQNVEEIRYF